MYWFSNYHGTDWTPDKGYNAVFAEVVRAIRSNFKLEKTNTPGSESGSGYWRQSEGHCGVFYINVNRFTWLDYRVVQNLLTPVLTLYLRIGRSEGSMDIEYPLEILFPSNYPMSQPWFRVNDPRFVAIKDSEYHTHHVMCDGLLDLGFIDWNPLESAVIGAIKVALDHLSWHYTTFGW